MVTVGILMYTMRIMSELFLHTSTFFAAITIIFLFGGTIVDATDTLAKKLNQDSFFISFVVLGLLTSLGEISVAINSSVEGVPQISAGNLIGASFVIFLLIVPFLAFFGKGIPLKKMKIVRFLPLALLTIGLPSFFAFDGAINRPEGAVMVVFYCVLFYCLKQSGGDIKEKQIINAAHRKKKDVALALAKIVLAGTFIFFSGRLLVSDAIFFSNYFEVPPSFIGLVLIALGTNVPELVIAIRAIMKRKKHIAFGDYIGSAALNTFILGIVSLTHGRFIMENAALFLTAVLSAVGLLLFYIFSRSHYTISRIEGAFLGVLYICFLILQFVTIS